MGTGAWAAARRRDFVLVATNDLDYAVTMDMMTLKEEAMVRIVIEADGTDYETQQRQRRHLEFDFSLELNGAGRMMTLLPPPPGRIYWLSCAEAASAVRQKWLPDRRSSYACYADLRLVAIGEEMRLGLGFGTTDIEAEMQDCGGRKC
jgi:hypothetical protein